MTQRDRSRHSGRVGLACVLSVLALSVLAGACNKPSAGPGLEPPAPGSMDAGAERDGEVTGEPQGGGGGLGSGGMGGFASGTGGSGGDPGCDCLPDAGDAADDDAGVEPDSGALR